GPGLQERDRLTSRFMDRRQASIGLHYARLRQVTRRSPFCDHPEITVDQGPDIGVDYCRARTLVLVHRRINLMRHADEDIWERTHDRISELRLVRRVVESPQKADRDGFSAGLSYKV